MEKWYRCKFSSNSFSKVLHQKNHIAVCGYHGWQDWYIASTTMSGGVPELNEKYVHTFEYNNMPSLENIFKKFKIAAVIMEPFLILCLRKIF